MQGVREDRVRRRLGSNKTKRTEELTICSRKATMPTLDSCALHIWGEGLESHARHGGADFPFGCYEDRLHREPLPPHWHDALEVLTVVEGRALLVAGSQRWLLEVGEGLFVNAGVLHEARAAAAGHVRLHTVVWYPRLVGGSLESVFWQRYLTKVVGVPALAAAVLRPESPWQRRCLVAVAAAVGAYEGESFGYEFVVRDSLSQVVCALAESAGDLEAIPIDARFRRQEDRVKAMLSFIHDHYAEQVTLDVIAASASIGVSECLRCFRRVLGTTPVQYLRRFRVRRAARLLESTDLKVADVGALCGFGEASYFTRAFRAEQGCTPSSYRESLGKRPK